MNRSTTTVFAAAVLLACAAAGAQTYHITDLGSLGGFGDADAFAIGRSGSQSIVAGFSTAASQNHIGFAWNASLGALVPMAPDTQSAAFGIDGLGRVIFASYRLGEDPVTALRSDGGAVATLGAYTPRGCNAAGDIVGFMSVTGASGLRYNHACLQPASGGAVTDLGTFASGVSSQAYAISSTGQVVGVSSDATGAGTIAVLWQNGQSFDLGTLGGTRSAAYAVNQAGVAAGFSATAGPSSAAHAVKFVLNPAGGAVSRIDLGALPAVAGVQPWSYAYGINDAGAVVGQSSERAFVSLPGGMFDLNALLPANSGWSLWTARAVDQAGHIAAAGVDSLGRPSAVLLTPCNGDFNRDYRVTVQDIFDFLSAWFAGNISADQGRRGTVTVQDIFDFLSAWFTPCV